MNSRNLRTTVALNLTLLIISGCAATGAGKIDELPPTTKIAVVSALGDDLSIETTGTTIFQNWERKENVSLWRVDSFVEDIINAELRKAGKFQIVDVDTSVLHQTIGQVSSGIITGKAKIEGGIGTLQAFGKSYDIDSLLFVRTIPREDIYFSTNQYFEGYGVYQKSFLGSKRALNYAIVHISLIDVQTGEEFAYSIKTETSTRNQEDWVEETDRIVEENLARTRFNLEALLYSAVTKALKNLTLI